MSSQGSHVAEDGHRGTAVPRALMFLAVCIVATNMRPTITTIGPLLEQISADTGIAVAALGGLTSVPLIAWAAVSPIAHDLSQRYGLNRVVMSSLLLLGAGTAIRSLPDQVISLWAGSLIIGVALALMNVLMPAVVKREFPHRVPAVTSVYTALLAGVGAIAAGVVVPISHIPAGPTELGWRFALLATATTLPLALLMWFWAMRRSGPDRPIRTPGPRKRAGVWKDPVAWQVGGYMGAQATWFYVYLTWIAPISTSTDRSEVVAGFDVMIYQIIGVIGSLTLPFVMRGALGRWIPALLPVIAMAGTLGIMVLPGSITVWSIMLGLASGSSLATSLTLMATRARDHSTSSALSGMAQSVGYIIASIGPPLFGWFHTVTGGWTVPLWFVIAVLCTQATLGAFVGRDRYVGER